MPRKVIKRYMPDHETIRRHKSLRFLGDVLHQPALWHLNRHAVAGAFFIGLMVAFVPVPFQMLLAAVLAILLRVNIPIAVALVWITNPFTMPPLFYFAYRVGRWALAAPPHDFHFEFSWHWLLHGLNHVWQPFLLGCFILGLLSGVCGYFFVQLAWRLYVNYKWRRRHG